MSTTPGPEGHGPSTPVAPQIVREIYLPPPRGFRWGRLFLVLALMALAGSVLMNFVLATVAGLSVSGGLDTDHRIQEKFVSHSASAQDKVAVLPIEGIILESEDGFIRRAIDHAASDESVKAVVLRIDSPGGSVSGSDYIYYHLRKLVEKRSIPIVVSMGSIAASGGYYVAMAAGETPDVLFAEPTSFTGSIGVIIPHYNLAELMDKVGAKEDSIASHPLKKMGSVTRPMTDEERKIFESLVSDSFGRFKGIVRSGRSKFQKAPELLDKLATGQVYSADQAKQNGLIDRIGFLEDAVDRAIELAGLKKDRVKVIRYKPETTLASILMGGEAHAAAAVDLKTLLDMTTPRAYYLFTWLPGLDVARP